MKNCIPFNLFEMAADLLTGIFVYSVIASCVIVRCRLLNLDVNVRQRNTSKSIKSVYS